MPLPSRLALIVLPVLLACGTSAVDPHDDALTVDHPATTDAPPADRATPTDVPADDVALHDASWADVALHDGSMADVALHDASMPDVVRTDAASPDAAHDGGTPTAFVHPGVLVGRAQLDFVKARIAAHAEPWYSAYNRVRASHFGSTSYVAQPVPVVELGLNSMPDVGGDQETSDAIAAYTQALVYYYSDDASYARRAAAILDAWATTLTGRTGANVPLRTAWSAEVFTRAAEILRHTYTGWPEASATRFASMLTRLYLPLIRNGWWGGNNWQTSMTEAVMNIAIYTDDRALFDHAVSMWRAGTPAYVYLASDGAVPVRPLVGTFTDAQLLANWHTPPRLVDGITMETCRDLGHTALGLAAVFNAAETARIQGIDLYGEQQRRLTVASEFNTQFMNGAAVPSWLCNGTLAQGGSADALTFEMAYNAYANRNGVAMPQTRAWVLHNRPTSAGLHIDWETLTHGDVH